MKVSMEFARPLIEKEEGLNHVVVCVEPPENVLKIEKPVAFILVLDNSGSMAEPAEHHKPHAKKLNSFHFIKEHHATKLYFVKKAAERLLDMMKDGDGIALVSFSDIARVEYDFALLHRGNRFRIKDRIRAIRTEGMTNVSDGLEKGFNQIPQEIFTTHHIKIILLSDGLANRGITNNDMLGEIVKRYRDCGASISTIGVGLDYNSRFMEQLATIAGGMFYHLETLELLDKILIDELQTVKTLTASGVTVKMRVPHLVALSRNINGFQEDVPGEVFLGNLFSKQEIVFEINTILVAEGELAFTAEVHYYDVENISRKALAVGNIKVSEDHEVINSQTNERVAKLVSELLEAKALKESVGLYEEGNFSAAGGLLNSYSNTINSINKAYKTKTGAVSYSNLSSISEDFRENRVRRSDLKEMYFRSHQRSRTSAGEAMSLGDIWVNVDIPTKKCTIHISKDCPYLMSVQETANKGKGELKIHGGWLCFQTFNEAQNYCKTCHSSFKVDTCKVCR